MEMAVRMRNDPTAACPVVACFLAGREMTDDSRSVEFRVDEDVALWMLQQITGVQLAFLDLLVEILNFFFAFFIISKISKFAF